VEDGPPRCPRGASHRGCVTEGIACLRGGLLRRSNFCHAVQWSKAVAAIGAPGLRDLMGYDSMRAVLIGQHKTAAANQAVANAMSAQIEAIERGLGDSPGAS